jgi:uncharacterized protein YndB with AHSA1/START domain
MRTETLAVTKSITVRASRERAFTVFAERFGRWWPASHHLGDADLADVIVEPRAGGRWYERDTEGVEHEWGRVLAYEPPARLLLAWHLQSDWKHDPDPARSSEIEVRFIPDGEHTRVEFEHRHIERHDDPAEVRRGVAGPNGWSAILHSFAEHVVA